ncbi:MAG: phosphoserine phosphatase SerB [Deltaproteobacteria bacterium RIFCSPLOWO2_02_FULL_44_10]|nr:MAG: phosphoserine phosphatase SerB [Deltaproteobacteria bacterium RIFCSPHIGHO2_02_FULL_44_16]OGQ47247.1 MAG: phosphoserine phosphatase SerB [Deltaproteobacteria bacterium RIFCSPLOWO2_02_FULL_44_10]
MTQSKNDIVLVTVRGGDTPGITAALTKTIAASQGAKIIDIEQTVVHKKLLLSFLLQFTHDRDEKTSLLKELLFAGRELGVHVDVEAFDQKDFDDSERHQYAITCLGQEVGALPLSRVAATLAKHQVNISKIGKMSQHSLSCVELLVEVPKKLKHATLSRDLLALASEIEIDIALQPADLSRRAKRLVVMDMDSTLVESEAIDELARRTGVFKKVEAITKKAMEGKIDFRKSLFSRVELLKGLEMTEVEAAVKKMKLSRGADRLIKVLQRLGYRIGVISGGFTPFTDHLKNKLSLDYVFANVLEVKNGKLTGKLRGRIIDGAAKAAILEEIAKREGISLDQVIAIGDGANDLPMLARAGMGVAFHAKDIVRKAAHTSIGHHAGLDSLLYLLGIRERELKGII